MSAIDAEPFVGGATMIIAGHFDQRIVVYPMGRGAKRGQLLTNWVCQLAVSDPKLKPSSVGQIGLKIVESQ
jgi:hypothetical protein